MIKFHLCIFLSIQGFVPYTDCFTIVIVFWEIGKRPDVVFLQSVRFRGWDVMKNNETCNALKCLKPSGLIDWIDCRLCNGWVFIKCANLSRMEARSLAKFKCSRCSLVNTIRQCQDDIFKPDTFFNSGVFHLKRVLKNLRIPWLKTWYPKLTIFEKPRQIMPCGAYSLLFMLFLEKNHLE